MNERLQLAERLRLRAGDLLRDCRQGEDMAVAVCEPAALLPLCKLLRDDPEFAFEQLSDLCGVDYAAYGDVEWETTGSTRTGFSRGVSPDARQGSAPAGPRFAVVYHLLSLRRNRRLRLRCPLAEEPPRVNSVTPVWSSANWYEREAFDLFGILFEGHPDLRRLLTDYGFCGHPFRKDFPLVGHVEVRYDPDRGRVVQEPVTIENRVLVPRVIRDEGRHRRPEPPPG
ncbi:MAG: NADH-quinone oxidoreductase subunit C [Gammaproteobacteria bacterium]|nr:NADH-quinone oxidoreductase subunit C [Gammaproteobacteria bacterium]